MKPVINNVYDKEPLRGPLRVSNWKPFLLYDGECRGESAERARRYETKAPRCQCAFSISPFLRPMSDISLSGPETMTNDSSCFGAIESER